MSDASTLNGIRCPACLEHKQSSRLALDGTFRTAMFTHSFLDEQGQYHHHDPNGEGYSFSCSNGHIGSISREVPCPAGDHGDESWTVVVRELSVFVPHTAVFNEWVSIVMGAAGWSHPKTPGCYYQISGPVEAFEFTEDGLMARLVRTQRVTIATWDVQEKSASSGGHESVEDVWKVKTE